MVECITIRLQGYPGFLLEPIGVGGRIMVRARLSLSVGGEVKITREGIRAWRSGSGVYATLYEILYLIPVAEVFGG